MIWGYPYFWKPTCLPLRLKSQILLVELRVSVQETHVWVQEISCLPFLLNNVVFFDSLTLFDPCFFHVTLVLTNQIPFLVGFPIKQHRQKQGTRDQTGLSQVHMFVVVRHAPDSTGEVSHGHMVVQWYIMVQIGKGRTQVA